MIELGLDEKLALVREASRAPSAHNAQPARWRFLADGRVVLFEDLRRRLTVGDPHGRDARISLGAAFEGLSIALSRRGIGLEDPMLAPVHSGGPETGGEPSPHLVRLAESRLAPDACEDPLSKQVSKRHTFRGKFRRPEPEKLQRLRSLLADAPDVTFSEGTKQIRSIARVHDRCIASFLKDPTYHAELYRWMRFRPTDPGWDRDGLTVDCLPFSGLERAFAGAVFHPRVFRLLARLGLAGIIGSEAGSSRSAACLAILHRPATEDVFHGGRRLYRLWLEICELGFHLCPMSATADSKKGLEELRRLLSTPDDSQVINLLRLGVAPNEAVPVSRRLPADELLV